MSNLKSTEKVLFNSGVHYKQNNHTQSSRFFDFILTFNTKQTAVIYCKYMYVLDDLVACISVRLQVVKREVYMVYDHRVDLRKENKSAKIKLHSVHNRSSYHTAHDC